MNPKESAARRAVEYVRDGMTVGLGTGSTAAWAIRALGERVAQGLSIQAVPTSTASADLAEDLGIELVTLEDEPVVDLTIDGADEVDPQLDLVKGLGGALLREKIVAAASTRRIIVVDASKLVSRLGTKAPLPVEVVPFGWPVAERRLIESGLRVVLRQTAAADEPFTSDNGNYILDCYFPAGIADPAETERRINAIPGVVENGLFVGLAHVVVVGDEGGIRVLERP
jgi:ribose 5-phosphate isomerase A